MQLLILDTLYFILAYTGWTDDLVEGIWTKHFNDSEKLEDSSFQPWSPGEPNGDQKENCALLVDNEETWDDISCDRRACILCDIPTYQKFTLRGKTTANFINYFCYFDVKNI